MSQEKSRQKPPKAALSEEHTKRLTVAASERESYERTIVAQPVSVTCAICGKEEIRMLYPGRVPLYCEPCAKQMEKEKTKERVANWREAHQKQK